MDAQHKTDQLLDLPEPDHQRKETKEEAFYRMAGPRMDKALHAIRLVGNLSNRGTYDYSSGEARAVLAALHDAVRDVEARFRNSLPAEPFRFRPDR